MHLTEPDSQQVEHFELQMDPKGFLMSSTPSEKMTSPQPGMGIALHHESRIIAGGTKQYEQ
jgi:hypothetical protein